MSDMNIAETMNLLSSDRRDGPRQENSVLLLIDIQNDFMPGGTLAVPGGDEISGPVRDLAQVFDNVILSQDWHPADHRSFASNHDDHSPFDQVDIEYENGTVSQTLWPDHCVQGTAGAGFCLPSEVIDKAQAIIRKGYRSGIDSYSAFIENDKATPTGLGGLLKERNIRHVFLAGLALDYCVAWSALSAIEAGLDAHVILPACRGIALESVDTMLAEMRSRGVNLVSGDPA